MIATLLTTVLLSTSFLATWFLVPQPSAAPQWETFAFTGQVSRDVWSKYDWQKLTTLCLVGFHDEDLVRFAQARGVRVVSISNIEKARLADEGYRSSWIREVVDTAVKYGLNGTNVDFEEDVDAGSAESVGYTALIRDLAERLHRTIPGAHLSVDVAWSPECIDGRCYEYAELGRYADKLFGDELYFVIVEILCQHFSFQLWHTMNKARFGMSRAQPDQTLQHRRQSKVSRAT